MNNGMLLIDLKCCEHLPRSPSCLLLCNGGSGYTDNMLKIHIFEDHKHFCFWQSLSNTSGLCFISFGIIIGFPMQSLEKKSCYKEQLVLQGNTDMCLLDL